MSTRPCRLRSRSRPVGRRTHYLWLDTDADYAQRFQDVEHDVTEALEAEARRHAQLGVKEPVYHKGKRVDAIRRCSDVLLYLSAQGEAA